VNSHTTVYESFISAKGRMKKEMQNGNYEKTLLEAEIAAQIATMHPILPSFVDEELEDFLIDGYKYHYEEICYKPIKGNVVFYNSQIANRGALSQQYLNYLTAKEYSVLVIVPLKQNTLFGDDIIKQIEESENVEIFIPNGNGFKKRIESLRKRILEFRAEYTFIHLLPYDAMGFSVLANLKSSIRYYIVHNDHTFWLGKKMANYFIEFRDFGKSIALSRRKIPSNQILECPYYPIVEQRPFEGFSFDHKGKIIALLASNPYKIMMDGKRTLLNLILEVIKENENFIVVIAGRFSKNLDNFINKNRLKGRLIPIGQRSDFSALMRKVDIYINSYPLIGGLTTQFAVEARIPIVSYTKPALKSTNWAEGLIAHSDIEITFTDKHRFKNRLNELIRYPELRLEFKDEKNISTYSRSDFENKLDIIIQDPLMNTINKKMPLLEHDDSVFLNYYLQRNHNLEMIRKQAYKKAKIETLFGERPYILIFKLKKILKMLISIFK